MCCEDGSHAGLGCDRFVMRSGTVTTVLVCVQNIYLHAKLFYDNAITRKHTSRHGSRRRRIIVMSTNQRRHFDTSVSDSLDILAKCVQDTLLYKFVVAHLVGGMTEQLTQQRGFIPRYVRLDMIFTEHSLPCRNCIRNLYNPFLQDQFHIIFVSTLLSIKTFPMSITCSYTPLDLATSD